MDGKDSPFNQHIRFSQNLSLWQAMARGLGVVIAGTTIALLGEAASEVGPLAPAAILLATLLMMLNSLGYAELAVGTPRPGGAYALVQSGTGGSGLAFLAGWALILSGLGFCGLLAQGTARHVNLLLAQLVGTPVPLGLLATGLLALLILESGLAGWRGRRPSLTLPIIVLLAALLLLAAPRLPRIGYAPAYSQPGPAIALLMAAFLGVEIVTSHQGEMRRRTTNLPRALLLTPALAAILGIGAAAVAGPAAAQAVEAPLAPLGEAIAGPLGQTATLIVGSIVLAFSAGRVLRMVVRLLYVMGQDGFWPAWLRQTDTQRAATTRVVLLLGLLALPATWIPIGVLSRTCGLLYLAVLMAVNLTLVRRPQANARPAFALPFHPWIPALTLAVDVLVIPLWGWIPLACAAGCLAIGAAGYLAYARSRYIEAQAGVTVFRPPVEEHSPPRFRVLVPIANPKTAAAFLRLAGRLAQFEGGDVLALQVVVVPEPVPLEAGSRRARAGQAILESALSIADQENLPLQIMTRAARSVAQGILDTAAEEKASLILMGWQSPTRGTALGRITDAVLRDAPCDVLVTRGEHASVPRRILVPMAGGPHARVAARLATLMAKAMQAELTLLYVQPRPATAKQMEENRHRIAEAADGLPIKPPPVQKVVLAPTVVEGIVQEAREHDLVLLGVSEESLLDRVVFGTIPLQVAARVPATALVQAYQGVTRIWTRRLLRTLQSTLPVLNSDERLEVQRELARGAQPGINFFVLIVLSCIIAALGLLLNSPAVVIGAMLVAPLMSPIMAFSLGLITGDLRVIRFAVEAILKGVAMAIIIAAFIGLLSPLKGITSEMFARGQPTLLDMAVALASGMAGAYALARKDVSAALPGVAIAAALMPPLATVGLSLSMGNAPVAGGAFLLFITNITAISLAAGIVFLVLGIGPQGGGPESHRQLRRRLIASLILLLAIAIPLSAIMAGIVRDTAQEQTVRETITQQLATGESQLVGLEIERREADVLIVATIRSSATLDEESVDRLAQMLSERLRRPAQLEVVILPVVRSAPTLSD